MRFRAALCLTTILAAATTASAAPRPGAQVGGCLAASTPNYTTIGAAVAGVATGATISICPGTYAEQVVLTRAVTLTGVTAANGSQPRIVPPSGGLVANTASLDDSSLPIAAQILASGATQIQIQNLTVDGSNNQISGCAPDVDGILFQNASGSITRNAVINQNLGSSDLAGCQSGQGIFIETAQGQASTVVISGNHVQDFQKDGITANDAGTAATITNNTVVGQGATPGAAENGIQVAFGATASVTANQVADEIYAPGGAVSTGNAASGILVYDAGVSQIGTNLVTNTQYGIVVYNDGAFGDGPSDGVALSANHIATTRIYDAIDLCGVQKATVTQNGINGSDEAAVHIDGTCPNHLSSASITANHIDGACAAILEGPSTTATQSKNTTYNAVSDVLSGSDACPADGAETQSALAVRRPAHTPRISVKK